MPMIGFKDRFTTPILNGTKTQTIRLGRKSPPTKATRRYEPLSRWWGYPPAHKGETLILSTGVRTSRYRELKRVTAREVIPVCLRFSSLDLAIYPSFPEGPGIEIRRRKDDAGLPFVDILVPYKACSPWGKNFESDDQFSRIANNAFAVADGFTDLWDFCSWFKEIHGIKPGHRRKGIFIGWLTTW